MAKNDQWDWAGRFSQDWLPEGLSITIDAQTVGEQIDRMRGFLQLQQVYRGAIREITTKLETLDAEFHVRYEHNPIHHINSRLKSPQSILEKLKRKGVEPSIEAAREYLTDIAGVRVICNYVEDIYHIADIVENQSDITLVAKRDYIANPKPNGYRSLHLIVKVPVFLSNHTENIPVEIQIRTIAMDFWATLEHELRYKSQMDMSDELRIRLKQCAETSSWLDHEMQAIRSQCIGKDKDDGGCSISPDGSGGKPNRLPHTSWLEGAGRPHVE